MSDITLPADDKKDTPVEDKKEEKAEVEAKVEDTPADDDSNKKEPEPAKEEPKTEDETDDLDLSDLFADLEDASDANDESKKILDNVAA